MTPNSVEAAPEFRAGLRDVAPLAFGVAVYGLAFGLLAAQAGMGALETGIMGATIFAGSAQIVAVERLLAGAGAGAALVAGLALNLRLFLVTASLRDILAGRPWWQIALGVHLAADENWALLHATRAQGRPAGYAYLIAAGTGLIVVWIVATVIGAGFAWGLPNPRAFGLDFAFGAAFVAILRSLWRGTGDLIPWIASVTSCMTLIAATPLAPSWALAFGGILGASVAGMRGHA